MFLAGAAMQTAVVKWEGREEFLAVMPSGTAVPFDAGATHKGGAGPMEMLLGRWGRARRWM